jgi:hypothetical protein
MLTFELAVITVLRTLFCSIYYILLGARLDKCRNSRKHHHVLKGTGASCHKHFDSGDTRFRPAWCNIGWANVLAKDKGHCILKLPRVESYR